MPSYTRKDPYGGRRGYYVSTNKTQSQAMRERVERQQLGIWDEGCFEWVRFDVVEVPKLKVRPK